MRGSFTSATLNSASPLNRTYVFVYSKVFYIFDISNIDTSISIKKLPLRTIFYEIEKAFKEYLRLAQKKIIEKLKDITIDQA